MLTFSSVMFTSHGNIRRKRKAPRVPPKATSDRIVMKKLRDKHIRQAGGHNENNLRVDQEDDQNSDDDKVNYNNDFEQDLENGEDGNLGNGSDDNDSEDDEDDNEDSDDNNRDSDNNEVDG